MRKAFFIILATLIIFVLIFLGSGGKYRWNSKDRYQTMGFAVTCNYFGAWVKKLNIEIVLHKSCMPI